MAKMSDYERGWRDCYAQFVQMFKYVNAERVKFSKPLNVPNASDSARTQPRPQRARKRKSNGEEARAQ